MTEVEPSRIAQRAEAGRARRERAPRSVHGSWAPRPDRFDPVAVLVAADEDRLTELVPIRHARMSVSAFTFYRGTAEIMAADLATTPTSGIDTQLCGDAHLLNFGLFASPERNLVFDLNDFDETARGPWEWDIKRLATSFEVAGRDEAMTPDQRGLAVRAAVRSYRTRLAAYATQSPLDIHYDRRDLGEIVSQSTVAKRGKRLAAAEAKARRRDSHQALERLAERDGDDYRIVDDPPIVFHPEEGDWRATVHGFMDAYRESLRPEICVVLDRYRLVDAAVKVVGVGSVGTRCFIALLLSDDDAPLFLQAKEAGSSVIEPHVASDRPMHHGERVVVGQRIMQSASDVMLGWATSAAGRDFYVRQLRDMKYSFSPAGASPADLAAYAEFCGWVLARAHAAAADAATITGYLGKGTGFDDALAEFAVAYADQNERDYAAFVTAIGDGRIEAREA